MIKDVDSFMVRVKMPNSDSQQVVHNQSVGNIVKYYIVFNKVKPVICELIL